MAEPIALTAMLADAAVGWPAWLYRKAGHPVGLFARWLAFAERRFNRADRAPPTRRAAGAATMALLLGGTFAATGGVTLLLRGVPFAWMATALLAWPAFSLRSLAQHVAAVARPLEARDTAAARTAVAAIVGRDTGELDDAGVARAAIESLAESFCDGVAAPLFWLLVAGLPGIWCYKAVNTADSMIGYRSPRFLHFGQAAARLDDAANLLPARLAAIILALAGGGWRILWRDHGRHDSPNAGWCEAAMAGALGLKLGGPSCYQGIPRAKPWIGDGRTDANARDIRRALRIYRRAAVLLLVFAGAFAWLR